jgi:uncharacterized membrane protein
MEARVGASFVEGFTMTFGHLRSRAAIVKKAMKRIEIIKVDWSDVINWETAVVVDDWGTGVDWSDSQ